MLRPVEPILRAAALALLGEGVTQPLTDWDGRKTCSVKAKYLRAAGTWMVLAASLLPFLTWNRFLVEGGVPLLTLVGWALGDVLLRSRRLPTLLGGARAARPAH